MTSIQDGYEDMLEPRRVELTIWYWLFKDFKPILPVTIYPKPTPEDHKLAVLRSPKIRSLIEEISNVKNLKKGEVEQAVKKVLDEIGFKKNLKVIKLLGIVLCKICLRVCSGIYINYVDVEKLKGRMGNCPVVFVPSHRSYGDFMLFSFVCFYYNIQIPAIAAAMDFHGMMGMGEMLRNTGAFYIKRAANTDPIYWPTFKEYIYQLMAHGEEPMEFFIEGTRSRTNKSIAPKYGLIMMILKAFFLGQVPDIMFVPVSINYDRILEESLFSFELLGIPKPKESTSGFFKSLKIVKERFGKIFIHFDEPISIREFFGKDLDRSAHSLGPVHIHDLTDHERTLIPPLSYEIVRRQQLSTVLSYFNLIALVLNNNLTMGRQFVNKRQLKKDIDLLRNVLLSWGGKIFTVDTVTSINESLEVHSNLIYEENDNIGLVSNKIEVGPVNPDKLKAHSLSGDTITYSVPFVMLQIYVNPVLHYLVDAALVVIILRSPGRMAKDELFKHFYILRSILSLEFVLSENWYRKNFEEALIRLVEQRIIKLEDGEYDIRENNYLEEILISSIQPFILTYFVVTEVLQNIREEINEKALLASIQKLLEDAISERKIFIHPYCMSLDLLVNALTSYTNKSLLNKTRRDNQNFYQINHNKVLQLKEELEVYLPSFHVIKSFEIFLHIRSKI